MHEKNLVHPVLVPFPYSSLVLRVLPSFPPMATVIFDPSLFVISSCTCQVLHILLIKQTPNHFSASSMLLTVQATIMSCCNHSKRVLNHLFAFSLSSGTQSTHSSLEWLLKPQPNHAVLCVNIWCPLPWGLSSNFSAWLCRQSWSAPTACFWSHLSWCPFPQPSCSNNELLSGRPGISWFLHIRLHIYHLEHTKCSLHHQILLSGSSCKLHNSWGGLPSICSRLSTMSPSIPTAPHSYSCQSSLHTGFSFSVYFCHPYYTANSLWTDTVSCSTL